MGAWESECQISQNYILQMKVLEFTCIITILVKFDVYFLGLPWEIFFGVTTDHLLHLKPLKNVKKNAILFKLIILLQDFCPLKIKITQFPGGFHLKLILDFHVMVNWQLP